MLQFIDSPEDMEWLRDVFKVPGEWGSATIQGNEDAPERIELFYSKSPAWNAVPDSTLTPDNWQWLS